MSNQIFYNYDPINGNQYTGWVESYTAPPHSTLVAPRVKPSEGAQWYEYRFDEESGGWQEVVHAIAQPPPVPEEEMPQEPAAGSPAAGSEPSVPEASPATEQPERTEAPEASQETTATETTQEEPDRPLQDALP